MKFEIVSVDMFGTLVDVSSIAPVVWRQFLKDKYTPELARQYWEQASDLFLNMYYGVIKKRQYVPPREIYIKCYSELFPKVGIEFDPVEAAEVLALQHSISKPFDEAAPFLDAVGGKYIVCLSSDTDEDMLGDLRNLYRFDRVFTSEEIGSYKTGAGGIFFSTVINHYGVAPEKIIHIGDSISDIVGAGEAGIATCWVNRKGKTWSGEIKPDYEVASLVEAASILGVEINIDSR